MKKVVLAFSGGLDTSYCAIYLSKEMGLEVHAALANTGGFSAEELASIEKRAYDLGVKSYVVEQDETRRHPLESARISFENLDRAMAQA